MKVGQRPSAVGCSLEPYVQTGNLRCRWVRGNRKTAEGETEPGKKADAASGHSTSIY